MLRSTSQLFQKVVVVTGGAGGIGTAIAQHFAQNGDKVVITSRTQAKMEPIISASNGKIFGVANGLQTEEDCVKLAKEVAAVHGKIDVVVHSAGETLNQLSARATAADFDRMFRVNTIIPCLLAKSVIRFGNMPRNRTKERTAANAADFGCFIGIGSVVAKDGNPGQVCYSASKAALVAAYKTMAREYGTQGVRFNVVEPGLIATAMANTLSDEKRDQFNATVALGRIGGPMEVAHAVDMCVKCTYMTGQVVTCDSIRK